jgi:hypothetical protein
VQSAGCTSQDGVIDDESLVKTRTNTCLSYTSAVPSYSVLLCASSLICIRQKHKIADKIAGVNQALELAITSALTSDSETITATRFHQGCI